RFEFQTPHGTVNDEMEDLAPLIGGRALEQFAVTLDQKNKRIRFNRPDTASITPPPLRSAGIQLRQEEDDFMVWNILPNSPAEKAGIRVGDKVVEIAGKPVEAVYSRPAWNKLLEQDSIEIRYVSSKSDKPIDVELNVIELIP
ncbi:MAG: PDZ domain-containing protein, partial [Phycisphaerae bacterium]